MSSRLRIAESAKLDLAYQHDWYVDQAFDQKVNRLSKHPRLGRPRRFRTQELSGIYSSPVGGSFSAHLIFYRLSEGEISIERVMHGARDLSQRLLEPPTN